jgi:hypothetical protein
MSYNIIINSEKNLNSSSNPNRNSLKYFIDWESLFINENDYQKYKMTWAFTSSTQIIQGNYTYLLYMSGLSCNQYIVGTTGASSSTSIGALKYGSSLSSSLPSYISTSITDNPPIYLLSKPTQNEFTIELRNNINNSLYTDDSSACTGTATLATTTLTIVSISSGVLFIGSKLTISGTTYKILSFGTGVGGTGTYTVDTSGTVGTATAFTTSRAELGPYTLLLNFEKVN